MNIYLPWLVGMVYFNHGKNRIEMYSVIKSTVKTKSEAESFRGGYCEASL